MCSSDQFSDIWKSQPPPKATPVGTDEENLGILASAVDVSKMYLSVCATNPFAFCDLFCKVIDSCLFVCAEWERLLLCGFRVSQQ